MKAEHLKVWLREETRGKDLEPRQWGKLMIVARLVFQEGRILTALTWTTMMIITKGVGKYILISLVEVIWKVCVLIIKIRLQSTIAFHYGLHGFR